MHKSPIPGFASIGDSVRDLVVFPHPRGDLGFGHLVGSLRTGELVGHAFDLLDFFREFGLGFAGPEDPNGICIFQFFDQVLVVFTQLVLVAMVPGLFLGDILGGVGRSATRATGEARFSFDARFDVLDGLLPGVVNRHNDRLPMIHPNTDVSVYGHFNLRRAR